jgi:hypothetical protein
LFQILGLQDWAQPFPSNYAKNVRLHRTNQAGTAVGSKAVV